MIPTLAAITWTPTVFYIAMGIIHTVLILVGFRVMQVDPEHNSFIGAVLAGVAINVTAFFVKDLGVIGIMVQIAVIFGSLVLVSSGEVLKAGVMALICVGLYGGVAQFVIPRTPLTEFAIGGFSQVIINGGMEAEPIDEEQGRKLRETGLTVPGEDEE